MSLFKLLPPLIVVVVVCHVVNARAQTGSNKLVLLFVDGLRWDLVNGPDLPGFRKLFSGGTRAHHLKPVFPSLCYPNFYTMMTGLYPESHGLVGNNVYDPLTRDFFSSRGDPETDAADHWWEGGEPIWVTANKQAKSSSLYYLAGCDRAIHGHRPASCRKVRNDLTLSNMVEAVRDGLDRIEEDKADFVAVYYGEVDTVGHKFGPNSAEMRQLVKDLDQVISYVLHDLWERGLSSSTNVVLISDHGMTDASIERLIRLRHLISREDVDHVLESGAFVSVWPKPGREEKVYMQLKSHPRLQVYMKDEIPDSWHYKGSHRVAPITALAELGWYIETHDSGYLGFGPRKTPAQGMHGYHTDHPDMWGVFAATGPDIEMNQTLPALGLEDVYQTLAYLLDLQPRPHNGSWHHVAPMFTPRPSQQHKFLTSYDFFNKRNQQELSSSTSYFSAANSVSVSNTVLVLVSLSLSLSILGARCSVDIGV